MFENIFRRKLTLEQELRQIELQERRRRIGEQIRTTGVIDRAVADAIIYDSENHLLDDLRGLPEDDGRDINRLTP